MQSEEIALKNLKDKGIEFTVNEFRRAISQNSADEIFHLFIQAGILKRIKSQIGILRYSIHKGSMENVQTILTGINVKTLSSELYFELIDRAAFEQYDIPDSDSTTRWKTLLYEFLQTEIDVNFAKVRTFKYSNLQETEEQSPLRLAVSMKDLQLVQLLIERGAAVNFQYLQDSYLRGGNLLHHIAAQKKCTDADLRITEILMQAGIQIDLRDNHNYAPLALCAKNGLTEIAQILIKNGAEIDSMVGLDEDRTILMYSIAHKNYDITRLLLDNGANIHHQDKNGWTAARLAFIRRNREIGEALITKGAILRPFIGLGGSPCKSGGITVETSDNTASGSAFQAGIRRYDIVVEADSQSTNTISELINIICRKRPLDTVDITVLRENELLEFTVEVQVM
jgi:hypothetical protein